MKSESLALDFGADEALAGFRLQRLAVCLLEPEDLGQGHRLVKTGVVKHAQHHRVAVLLAQGHRPAGAALLVAFALEVAQHVAAQAALACIGAGRLVVGHAVRRHEQGGHGVDQR